MTLPPGLYEQLITRALEQAIESLKRSASHVEVGPLDPGDSHELLARHVNDVLRSVLRAIPHADRLDQQVALCNRILNLIGSDTDVLVRPPAEALLDISDASVLPTGTIPRVPRPHVPLSASDLLVNARGDGRGAGPRLYVPRVRRLRVA